MNKTVVRMCIFHILMCIILASSTFMWNDNTGNYSFYLSLSNYEDTSTNKNQDIIDELKKVKDQDFDGQGKQSYGTAGQSFFTYYMLSSTFIPISMYVTIELVKIW